jgi:hypothetical protein
MKNIAAALVKAQKAFGPALKGSTNPHFKSRYADLAACVEAVIDSLNANGIALVQQTHECDNGVVVETVFVHESGEIYSAGKLHVPAAKHDPQGYGSALTYARRYSLMAACGIAPEDDDGNAAVSRMKHRPVDGALVLSERMDSLQASASLITDSINAGEIDEAIAEIQRITDVEEKTAIWGFLPSHVRSKIKTTLRDTNVKN